MDNVSLLIVSILLIVLLIMIYTGVAHNHHHLLEIMNKLEIENETKYWNGDEDGRN